MATRLGIKRVPHLLQSEDAAPFLVGIVRPLIVVPRSLRQSEHINWQLEAVLAHELAHLKRRDLVWNGLLWAAQTLFWFHPLAWTVRRFHTLEVESACDELVLQMTRITPKSYGELLVNTLDFHGSPLTAGVGDGFFALKTRLSRLNRSPRAPRRIALVAFSGVIALTFCALVPFRLVARAQTAKPQKVRSHKATPSQTTRAISGTVRDRSGKPVSGATVYTFVDDRYIATGGSAYKQTVSDANGRFYFPPQPAKGGLSYIFVDAGMRGMGQSFGSFLSPGQDSSLYSPDVQIVPCVSSTLRFLTPQNRPAAGLSVGLGSVSPTSQQNVFAYHLVMPHPVLSRFNMTTNAQGEVVVPPLPRGGCAVFGVSKNNSFSGTNPDFALLADDGMLVLNSAHPTKTIRLMPPSKLVGHVTYGQGGTPVPRASISLWRIVPDHEYVEEGRRNYLLLAGTGTNTQGDYLAAGLRPGRYRMWARSAKWDWASEPRQIVINQRSTRIDLALAPAPVIEGHVISARTKRPLSWTALRLYDSQGDDQEKLSDVNGHFTFYTLVGKQRLVFDNRKIGQDANIQAPTPNHVEFSLNTSQKRTLELEMPESKTANRLGGIVQDTRGRPVAGAVVYAMRPNSNGQEPVETVICDAQGNFVFPPRVSENVELLADAGDRGMGHLDLYGVGSGPNWLTILPSVRTTLRFVDARNRPVSGVPVCLWRVGQSDKLWTAIPAGLLQNFQAVTNEQGEVHFRPLPTGMLAQFRLGTYSMGKYHEETRFAQASVNQTLVLSSPRTFKTLRLFPGATLGGRVTLPGGQQVAGAFVYARAIDNASAGGKVKYPPDFVLGVQSNSLGNYIMKGLLPGKYQIEVYPSEKLKSNWIGNVAQQIVHSGANQKNFVLSSGVLIQGVVLSQVTKQPVKGQTMGLTGAGGFQYAITDARGYFRFVAPPGAQHLWVHENSTNSPPPGFALPAVSSFDFNLKKGEKRDFKVELPAVPLVKPVEGVVIGADDQPAAGANVMYRTAGAFSDSRLHQTQSDGNGKFAIPENWSKNPVQLFADKGEQTTARSIIAVSGQNARLQLQENGWARIDGQVLDENRRPVSGVAIKSVGFNGPVGLIAQKTTSDANGRFELDKLRPGTGAMVTATKNGFSVGTAWVSEFKAGYKHSVALSLAHAPKTLRGLVLDESGKPAQNYNISADGTNQSAHTGNDGRFFLPQVLAGNISVWISSPYEMGKTYISWPHCPAHGGDQNVVIRLSRDKRDRRSGDVRKMGESGLPVGKTAPQIQASRWGNNRIVQLSSLRGHVVLLTFDTFYFNRGTEVSDFARSFAGRVEVVGVQENIRAFATMRDNVSVDETARDMSIPVALDAESKSGKTLGQTATLYGGVSYTVIGRDGKVVYAGNALDRAIKFALNASSR